MSCAIQHHHFTAEQPDKPDLASVGNNLASGPLSCSLMSTLLNVNWWSLRSEVSTWDLRQWNIEDIMTVQRADGDSTRRPDWLLLLDEGCHWSLLSSGNKVNHTRRVGNMAQTHRQYCLP